jgi:hypothetical protein
MGNVPAVSRRELFDLIPIFQFLDALLDGFRHACLSSLPRTLGALELNAML